MTSHARLDWNGDDLIARVAEAAREAIDETLAEADADASASHWWVNRTGNLESEIVTEDARVEGTRVAGRFGTTTMRRGRRTGWYGLFHEYTTPFLRPAADRTFPTLAAKIARRLK